MLYCLECFQLAKADFHSFDFTFNRFCMKLFKTGSIDLVKDCQNYFAIDCQLEISSKAQRAKAQGLRCWVAFLVSKMHRG